MFDAFMSSQSTDSVIGNARIQGMGTDLELTGFRFNWALTIFYFTYIA